LGHLSCFLQLEDNLNGTALHEACKSGHDEIITLLKEHGAECALLLSIARQHLLV